MAEIEVILEVILLYHHRAAGGTCDRAHGSNRPREDNNRNEK
jgi:hypothetical protein